jgi:hypothetical protein
MTSIAVLHDQWDRKLRRLQRAHPERWHVATWSDDEVRGALTLRLIERAMVDARDDDEWALAIVTERLAELRRANRLRSTPMDLRGAPLMQAIPSHEDRFLEHEDDACRAIAGLHAEQRLTKPQRAWLHAMRDAAERGAFFASTGELNLSAASRLLGKHRSSAQRAWEELRIRFMREHGRLR